MSWEQIGKELGISEGRVRQLFNRAMLKMKSALLEDPKLEQTLLEEFDLEHLKGRNKHEHH